MLKRITNNGRCFEVKSIANPDDFQKWIDKFDVRDLETVYNYIESKIAAVSDKFSAATHFNSPWPPELMLIWRVCNRSDLQSAYLLGRIIQDVVIGSDESWCCTKTDIARRGLDTNFYWKDRR